MNTSVPSLSNFGIDRLEFAAGIVHARVPVHTTLVFIDARRPVGCFAAQLFQFPDPPPPQTLPCQSTRFALPHVQPTFVPGRVTELDAIEQLLSPVPYRRHRTVRLLHVCRGWPARTSPARNAHGAVPAPTPCTSPARPHPLGAGCAPGALSDCARTACRSLPDRAGVPPRSVARCTCF